MSQPQQSIYVRCHPPDRARLERLSGTLGINMTRTVMAALDVLDLMMTGRKTVPKDVKALIDARRPRKDD